MYVSRRVPQKSDIHTSTQTSFDAPEPEVERLPLVVSALIALALSAVGWAVILFVVKITLRIA